MSRCSLASGFRLCGMVMLPTVPCRGRLAQLADLRPLQFVHLTADARQRAADQREQLGELRAAVAGGQPGYAGIGQAERGAETGPDS